MYHTLRWWWYYDRGWKIIMWESFKITMCTLFFLGFYKHYPMYILRIGILYKQTVLYIAFSFMKYIFYVCSTSFYYYILFSREQTLCINNEVFEFYKSEIWKTCRKCLVKFFLNCVACPAFFPFLSFVTFVCINVCLSSCGKLF